MERFITDKVEKYDIFISYIEQINNFLKKEESIDLVTENILKNFLERYNISFKNEVSVLLHQFLRVRVGIILMLLYRKGRWNDFMENRYFYNSVFNQLERKLDKQHTISEFSERIDREKIKKFEEGFKKTFRTVLEVTEKKN